MKFLKTETNYFTLTGSSVLKSIQDNKTPKIDILVRETIQNALDVVLPSKQTCIVNFYTGKFISNSLIEKLDTLKENVRKKHLNENSDFIAIGDKNTYGLTGSYDLNVNDQSRLKSLVFRLMDSTKTTCEGGSWGLGKSVYFRLGSEIVFYYTRICENGQYIEKLIGSLIENETSNDRILPDYSTGIGFFGEIVDGNKSKPIENIQEIHDFLQIFNIKPYDGEETGTVIIIPFINVEKMLATRQNNEETAWANDLSMSIKIAVQRWFFPRLITKDKTYFDKNLICAINGEMIELNSFFTFLQQFFYGKVKNEKSFTIKTKTGNIVLGTFEYGLFTREDLRLSAPNNLPSPNALFDIDKNNEDKQSGILFYTRSLGMIINYDNKDFGTFLTNEGQYLIGCFILNKNTTYKNESLDDYFRLVEHGSHTLWNTDNVERYPNLSELKPYKIIKNNIKKALSEEFIPDDVKIVQTNTNRLGKTIANFLMPPLDFGNQPSINSKSGSGSGSNSKKIVKISFKGYKDGLINYDICVDFGKIKSITFIPKIISSRKFNFSEWEEMGFDVPYKISCLNFYKFEKNYDKNVISTNYYVKNENLLKKHFCDYAFKNEVLYFYEPSISKTSNLLSFSLNNENNLDYTVTFTLSIMPIELTHEFYIDYEIEGGNK